MEVVYKATFIRQFNKSDPTLRDEIVAKIALFKDIKKHNQLKVHKLDGRLQGCYSFSVNYRIRIVFQYETRKKVSFLAVGSHKVYE
jgi:mRNA-degrading endonuclease YafQ of YafQ-DinJ toxin-antitoxin module